MQTVSQTACDCGHDHHQGAQGTDADWEGFLAAVATRFSAVAGDAKSLHVSAAHGLWEAYLGAFTDDVTRQVHDCNTCKHFIEHFGNLVVVNDDGTVTSAVWELGMTPDFYKPSVDAMLDKVNGAQRVTQPFYSALPILGQAQTGEWHHLSAILPPAMVFAPAWGKGHHTRDEYLAAGHQHTADRVVLRSSIRHALNEFTPEIIQRALTLVESDGLHRGGAVHGGLKFLGDLHEAQAKCGPNKIRRENLLWRAVAEAPDGHLHPRSGMVGKLLTDLSDPSLTLDDVKKKFAAEMNGLDYRRPQAAPKAGNIARAEGVIAELVLARSLERRFARLHEIEALWRPAPPPSERQGGGVFAGVQARGAKPRPVDLHVSSDKKTITFVKFRDTVLMGGDPAKTIEAYVGESGPFASFVTALFDDAPPIIKWDSEERRNPFTWYTYGSRKTHSGTPPSQWGLQRGWVKVNAIARSPAEWGTPISPSTHSSYRSAILVLEGCVDTANSGNALFPEFLRPELHSIAPTVEAFAKTAKIHGRSEASAAGLMISASGQAYGITVRVTNHGVVQTYLIDRWD